MRLFTLHQHVLTLIVIWYEHMRYESSNYRTMRTPPSGFRAKCSVQKEKKKKKHESVISLLNCSYKRSVCYLVIQRKINKIKSVRHPVY